MLGAIIGDIVGSRFEWNNLKTKDFLFFHPLCRTTDDSVMSLAIAKAILLSEGHPETLSSNAIACMKELGYKYPRAGYGGSFVRWLKQESPQPYQSYGNGSAMRVSACGFAANSLEEAISMATAVTAVSHNHPEGLKGAESVAVAVYMARTGCDKAEIFEYINSNYYKLDFALDDIRATYDFDVSCQGSVPQAFVAFFESTSYEDAIRNAISIGGDSDTIAAIAGGIAEAYYGIPAQLREEAKPFIGTTLMDILTTFEQKYPPKEA